MPAEEIFATEIQTGERIVDGTIFQYTIYLNPSSLPRDTQRNIVEAFGTRKQKGKAKACLGITRSVVRKYLRQEEFTAIIFVRNRSLRAGSDECSGSIQYYNWCKEKRNKTPQLWINDICRITKDTPKPATSPVKVLFQLLEELARSKRLPATYLMVDTDEPGKDVLPTIYETYGYHTTTGCTVPKSRIMKKDIRYSSTRQTRKSFFPIP